MLGLIALVTITVFTFGFTGRAMVARTQQFEIAARWRRNWITDTRYHDVR